MTAPLLSVHGVKTFYGNIMALKGIDLEVNEGEIVALIGANGAGKSTLMMTIFGDPRLSEGSIMFDGRDISRLTIKTVCLCSIATFWAIVVESAVFPMPGRAARITSSESCNFRMPTADTSERGLSTHGPGMLSM